MNPESIAYRYTPHTHAHHHHRPPTDVFSSLESRGGGWRGGKGKGSLGCCDTATRFGVVRKSVPFTSYSASEYAQAGGRSRSPWSVLRHPQRYSRFSPLGRGKRLVALSACVSFGVSCAHFHFHLMRNFHHVDLFDQNWRRRIGCGPQPSEDKQNLYVNWMAGIQAGAVTCRAVFCR